MKHLILLLGGILAVSAQAQLTTLGAKTNATPIPLLKATVTGTVEVVQQVTPGVTRVRTSLLNNKRIFEEFSVSKNDYELVIDANDEGILELVPRSASSPLPTIQVFLLDDTRGLLDTKLNFGDVFDTVSSTATGNLFQGLGGAVRGRVTFAGPVTNPVIVVKKFVFSINAFGTNQGGPGGKIALLKGRVVAAGNFVQKP